MDVNWVAILLTALFSSAFTLMIGGVLAWRIFLPALERHVDRKADDTALRMEQLLRQRIAQGFAETIDALREILMGRAGQVARSTADIFGDSVRRVLDRLGTPPPRNSYPDEDGPA